MLGESDGLCEGSEVGDGTGAILGPSDGGSLHVQVGASLSSPVGASLSSHVGKIVGHSDDSIVGSKLGTSVECSGEGRKVGKSLSSNVGRSVRVLICSVGTAVGLIGVSLGNRLSDGAVDGTMEGKAL